jgi:hypothetical protein
MGKPRQFRKNSIALCREDGSHRVWISEEDARKLIEGGHAVREDEKRVRLLSDKEKGEARRSLEAVGLRTHRRMRGLGGVF